MGDSLQDKKRLIEIMQLEMNILKLEAREMEIDEERVLIKEKIQGQKTMLSELKAQK